MIIVVNNEKCSLYVNTYFGGPLVGLPLHFDILKQCKDAKNLKDILCLVYILEMGSGYIPISSIDATSESEGENKSVVGGGKHLLT